MGQKGSILPILLVVLVVAIVVFLALKFVPLIPSATTSQTPQSTSKAPEAASSATQKPLIQIPQIAQSAASQTQIYTDKDLGFQFEYAEGFEILPESEEDYFKLTQTDYRKNFTGYVGYQPPSFVKALILNKVNSKISSEFDSIPLTLWIFENPNQLNIDAWFDKYWYYPFVWGVFSFTDKGHILPTKEATISGHLAKSVVVTYRPGHPEFIYVANGDKMFLFRVIRTVGDTVVTKALESFKFN